MQQESCQHEKEIERWFRQTFNNGRGWRAQFSLSYGFVVVDLPTYTTAPRPLCYGTVYNSRTAGIYLGSGIVIVFVLI